MKLPEIRIRFGGLLTENASEPMNELYGKGEELMSRDDYIKIVDSYCAAWESYEEKILRGMCEITGLTFRQNIIDVYIAPWFWAFSDPMVVGVTYKPDKFVDVLTHELLHRLLTDNNESPYDTEWGARWKKLFGQEHGFGRGNSVLVHIPVHALLQAIFDDVLNEPERTIRDKMHSEKSESYDRAWKYVKKYGYKNIVKKLRDDYEQLNSGRKNK